MFSHRVGDQRAAPLARDCVLSRGGSPEDSAAEVGSRLAGGQIELILARRRFVFRSLELPQQAADFLDAIVRSQIDRLTPWNPSQAALRIWRAHRNVERTHRCRRCRDGAVFGHALYSRVGDAETELDHRFGGVRRRRRRKGADHCLFAADPSRTIDAAHASISHRGAGGGGNNSRRRVRDLDICRR